MKHLRFSTFARFVPKVALLIAFGIIFCVVNPTLAEESGVFVGLNVGYGEVNMDTDFSFDDTGGVGQISKKGKLQSGGGVNYGVIVGYKQFFSAYLGLRYYANFSALHANLKPTAFMIEQSNISSNQQLTLLNYGVNVDFLGNFVVHKSLDFGGFVGVGIGGDSYLGKDLDNYINSFLAQNANHISGWNPKRTHFSAWANVGLRINVAKYHGIEIYARVPFVKSEILNNSNGEGGVEFKTKATLQNPYNVGVRYSVSF